MRRRTRYEKLRARKALRALSAVLACLCLLGAGAGLYVYYTSLSTRPEATLHEKGEQGYIPVAAEGLDLEVSAPQVFVYDCSRAEVIYQKGVEQVLYPASTTKLLTILCALEVLSPSDIVTAGDELALVQSGSSLAYIKSGHKLSVEMLVEAMLLPSGNDAAYVLAAAAGRALSDGEVSGREAVEVFMTHLADYAASLGLVGTVFTSPDGLAGKEHYSTLEDMLLVARLADRNTIIRRYSGLHTATVTYASGQRNTWENTNALIDPESPYYRDCVSGLKTGSLDKNYCVIATVEKNGQRYIIGIFGAKDKNARFSDAVTIIDALFPAEEVGA